MTENYDRFTITNNILSNASLNKIHRKWLKHSKHHALSSNDKNEFAKTGKLLYFFIRKCLVMLSKSTGSLNRLFINSPYTNRT